LKGTIFSIPDDEKLEFFAGRGFFRKTILNMAIYPIIGEAYECW